MIYKMFAFILVFNIAIADEKTIKNFTTNMATLNGMTVNFNKDGSEFLSEKYDRYYLYRALVLNLYLIHI